VSLPGWLPIFMCGVSVAVTLLCLAGGAPWSITIWNAGAALLNALAWVGRG
jgi:hypothetical protein